MISIRKTARWFRATPVRTSAVAAADLLESRQMWTMLDRERLRADRSGSIFSLLVLRVSPADQSTVSEILARRLRRTDVPGNLGRDQIGVFLPDTGGAGAWKLADDLAELIPVEIARPECEVYVHPHLSWPLDRSETVAASNDRRSNDEPPANGHLAGHAATVPVVTLEKSSDRLERRGAGRPAAEPAAKSQALSPLFAQPLPWWKRGLDLAGASVGLALLAPLFAIVAVAVKSTSPGPVFFLQRREGLAGRIFYMVKFRTMCAQAEAQKASLMALNEQDGPAFKIDKDPRVTPLGNVLRKLNIDELPQLWNVLRGEMSLVGPRPLPVDESQRCDGWQRRRLDITPGMTCIWQIRERRNSIPFGDWMRMDLAYARRRTLVGDLGLIVRTVGKLVPRRTYETSAVEVVKSIR